MDQMKDKLSLVHQTAGRDVQRSGTRLLQDYKSLKAIAKLSIRKR